MHDKDAITWFEIPSVDLQRAVRFYGDMLGQPLKRMEMFGAPFYAFAYQPPGVGGCVVRQDSQRPSDQGTIPYLRCPAPLADALARATAAGGRTVQAPLDLPDDMGKVAQIIDSEGNRVGLHATH